jgi:hypothetical protein
MKTFGIHCPFRSLLPLAFMGILASAAFGGTITYTYTGNPFNDLRNGATCPPVCSVTGSFTVAQALAPDLPLTTITPLSFNISSGGITLTDGEPTDTSLAVGTDGSGAITSWVWVVVGPAASPTARILTENVSSVVADDFREGNNPPPFVGPTLGLIQNDPGTWSSVPEPGSLPLVSSGVLLFILAVTRKR